MSTFLFSLSRSSSVSVPPSFPPVSGQEESFEILPKKMVNLSYNSSSKVYEKTSGNQKYDAGFIADKMIFANTGAVICQVEGEDVSRFIALSADHQNWSFETMDFGLLFGNNGACQINENTVPATQNLQPIAYQDVWFKIEVTPDLNDSLLGNVKYYSSTDGISWGSPIYESNNKTPYPIYVTSSLYNIGNKLKNCSIVGTNIVDTILPLKFVKKFLSDNNYNAFGQSFSYYNSNGNIPIDEVHHYTRAGVGGHIGVYAYTIKNVYHKSTDTWDAPINVIDEGNAYDLRDPRGGYIGNTLFIFMQKNTTNLAEQKFGYYKSSNNGASFGGFTEILGYDEKRAFPFGYLQPSNVPGTYFQYFTDFDHNANSKYNNYILKTIDNGINWTIIKINSGLTVNDFITESALSWLGGQKYLLLMRNGSGVLMQMTSSDNWQTWTSPVVTNLGGTGYPASLLPTMCDIYYNHPTDDLYIIYQDRTIGRIEGIKVKSVDVFSSPTNYPAPIFTERNRQGIHNGIGYPSIIKIQDNPLKLHMVYSDESTPERTNDFCDAKYTLFDENLR